MCFRRILPDAVPQPADQIRETSAASSFPTDGVLASHRTALLREIGWQDPDRNAYSVSVKVVQCSHNYTEYRPKVFYKSLTEEE